VEYAFRQYPDWAADAHELAGRANRCGKPEVDYVDGGARCGVLAAFMNLNCRILFLTSRKDALYCDAPSSLARKAALTTIDMNITCDARDHCAEKTAPVLAVSRRSLTGCQWS
jgi:hypothetical protein